MDRYYILLANPINDVMGWRHLGLFEKDSDALKHAHEFESIVAKEETLNAAIEMVNAPGTDNHLFLLELDGTPGTDYFYSNGNWYLTDVGVGALLENKEQMDRYQQCRHFPAAPVAVIYDSKRARRMFSKLKLH